MCKICSKLLCSKYVKHQNSITDVVVVSLLIFTFNLIHIFKCISKINEVLITFFENSRIWFVKLLGSIVNNMDRINTKKRNTTYSQCSKCSRTMITSIFVWVKFNCANQLTGFYMKATLALNGLNVTVPLISSLTSFLWFFTLSWKSSW